MLQPGLACKVTLYFNEDTSATSGFLQEEVLGFLRDSGIEGATMLRPFAGYGLHRRMHQAGEGPVTGEHLPIMVVFVDSEQCIRAILPRLKEIVVDGLIEMHAVEVVQHSVHNETVDGR